jgi:hypothetical protein
MLKIILIVVICFSTLLGGYCIAENRNNGAPTFNWNNNIP